MTYFVFLSLFLIVPIILFGLWMAINLRRGKRLSHALSSLPVWVVLATNMILALIYTTPWDNYLVASGVWWYNRNLVTGIVFGWVPIVEYTFFLLQPILSGLWLLTLARYFPASDAKLETGMRVRMIPLVVLLTLWVFSAVILLSGWKPGTYLGLELIWALPPVMLQFLFGADILWKHRRAVLIALGSSTLYLTMADFVAISAGTWAIDAQQ